MKLICYIPQIQQLHNGSWWFKWPRGKYNPQHETNSGWLKSYPTNIKVAASYAWSDPPMKFLLVNNCKVMLVMLSSTCTLQGCNIQIHISNKQIKLNKRSSIDNLWCRCYSWSLFIRAKLSTHITLQFSASTNTCVFIFM